MRTCMIFDLDGTLLDSLQDLYLATNATLAHFGCPERTFEEVRRFVGNGARRLMNSALPGEEKDPDIEDVLSYFQSYYGAHNLDNTRPYPGILEALEEIQKDFPVAIVSNKPHSAVKTLCARFFPGVYAVGEQLGIPRKPAADMVFKCMRDLDAENCIYIGDSEVDIATAANAGVPCLSVTWGFRSMDTLLEAGAKNFCHQTADLPEILKKIHEEAYGQ